MSAMGGPPGVSSVRSSSEQLAGVGDVYSAREIGEWGGEEEEINNYGGGLI